MIFCTPSSRGWSPLRRLLQALACALGAAVAPASAWGPQGHAAVADIAAQLLEGTPAGERMAAVLASGPVALTPAQAAVWSDCVKGIDPFSDFKYTVPPGRFAECGVFEQSAGEIARMADYVRRNTGECNPQPGQESCHKQYHYTNPAWPRAGHHLHRTGTQPQDVVGALYAALTVLAGGATPSPMTFANPPEALAVAVHLVADLHQPLHSVGLYLDAEGRLIDPDGQPDDPLTFTAGGNLILLADGKGNLHGYWDQAAARAALDAADALPALVAEARRVPPTLGSPANWATLWADDVMDRAAPLVDGLTFSPREETPRGPRWRVTLPSRYEEQAQAFSRAQIVLAGARLAEVLRWIWR